MRKHPFTALALSLALSLSATSIYAQKSTVRGAIFTTVSDGTIVNANHFESKCAVHLDGGPGPNAPAGAAGLADGDYFFQVTDPSGKKLLSKDSVANRRFLVTNGVITAYTGLGSPVHPTGTDRDHPELGAITIRLANATCPVDYLDSPNDGGTYKVWATPVGDFAGNPAAVDSDCGNGCFHGFLPSKSKTDNFKAKSGTPTFCLTVKKDFDDGWGNVAPKANWQINVTDPLSVVNTYFTDASGQVKVCGLIPGAYTVQEEMIPDAIIAALTVNGNSLPAEPVYSFSWSVGKSEPVVVFQNVHVIPPE